MTASRDEGLRLLGIDPATMNGHKPGAEADAAPIVTPAWPTLDDAALHGLAGDVVLSIAPFTEADDVATLTTFLLLFGAACNRGPHVYAGEDRHAANLFAVLVGGTSKARKGASLAGPIRLLKFADAAFVDDRVGGGLSSGEGLIWAVRDAIVKLNKKREPETVDVGVDDKRLVCIEEEFSAVLKVAEREKNTVSEQLRRAYDGRHVLGTMTKNSPARATDPHIAVLGHITIDELRRTLTETEMANGLGNRFLWLLARRSKVLPEPERMTDADAAMLGNEVKAALDFARRTGEVKRDEGARARWREVYGPLSEGKPGLVGSLTARGEAHVLRLSLVYALLDRSTVITAPHIDAALAFWRYAEASTTYIFGTVTGDAIADRILAALKSGGPMDQTAISELFGRHEKAARLNAALETLATAGCIRGVREETGGRPRIVWQVA